MAGIDENTKLIMHFDGSDDGTVFTDDSGNSFNGTATQQAVTSTDDKKFGSASLYCPNKDSFITIADDIIPEGTADWTIDFWYKTADITTAWGQYYWRNGTDDSHRLFAHNYNWSGGEHDIKIGLCWNNENPNVELRTNTHGLVDNSWNHIAYARYNGEFLLFINGDLAVTSSGWGSYSIPNFASNFIIGHASDQANIAAYFDEFRVSDIARWTADFTPPTEAYSATATTAVKSANGLANASVKAVQGLARASVKSINGLA
jgi:hypothetical protein